MRDRPLNTQWIFTTGVPTLILLAGVIDDLRARKVSNRLVLVCLGMAAVNSFLVGGWNGLLIGGAGLLTAFLFHVPLVYVRVLGAGDMKIMMAFGMATNWQATLAVSLFALLWGALLGIFRALLSGQIFKLFQNTLKMTYDKSKIEDKSLTKIPYTVALFFGWLSHLAGFQGALL